MLDAVGVASQPLDTSHVPMNISRMLSADMLGNNNLYAGNRLHMEYAMCVICMDREPFNYTNQKTIGMRLTRSVLLGSSEMCLDLIRGF